MGLSRDQFKGMGKSQPSQKGVYLTPGMYEVEIVTVLYKYLREGGEALIVEGNVTKSSNAEHPIGAKRTVWYKGMKYKESAFGEMRLFVYSVLGLTNEEVKKKLLLDNDPEVEKLLYEACENGAFNGQTLGVEVTEAVNPNSGKKYLKQRFFSSGS